MISSHTDENLQSMLHDYIKNNRDALILIFFIGQACLMGADKTDRETIVENFSRSAVQYQRGKSNEKFQHYLREIIKETLNTTLKTSFDETLRVLAQTHINSNLSSLSHYLKSLLHIVVAVKDNNFEINHSIISKATTLTFATKMSDSNALDAKKIIEHVQKRNEGIKLSGGGYGILNKNPAWKALFKWADEQDKITNAAIKDIPNKVQASLEERVNKGNKYMLYLVISMAISLIIVTLLSPNKRIKKSSLPLSGNEMPTNEMLLGITSQAIFVLIASALVWKTYNSIIKRETSVAVDSYRSLNSNKNEISFDETINSFFDIQLIEFYPTDINTKEEIVEGFKEHSQHLFRLTPTSEDSFLPEMNTEAGATPTSEDSFAAEITSGADNQKHSIVTRMKQPKNREMKNITTFLRADNEKSSVNEPRTAKTYTDTYERTDSYLIRYMTRGEHKAILVLDTNVLDKIKDTTMRKTFLKSFKSDIPKNLTGGPQSEIKSRRYDARLFGVITKVKGDDRLYGQRDSLNGKTVVVFNKFAKGLH